MTKDLEETVAELGPEYRAVVDRVVAAYAPRGDAGIEAGAASVQQHDGGLRRRGVMAGWSAAYLVAASLLVLLGLGVLFCEPTVRGTSDARLVYTVAYAPDACALRAMCASQHDDGSWDNDFITRQNAAALRATEDPAQRIAYKKAVRYLKSRGLRPLSEAELKMRGDAAARMLAKI